MNETPDKGSRRLPADIKARLIAYANCNRCELTPDDARQIVLLDDMAVPSTTGELAALKEEIRSNITAASAMLGLPYGLSIGQFCEAVSEMQAPHTCRTELYFDRECKACVADQPRGGDICGKDGPVGYAPSPSSAISAPTSQVSCSRRVYCDLIPPCAGAGDCKKVFP